MAVTAATAHSRPADCQPLGADRRAGERGRDTEGERERVRKREGRETSARAAFQSESFVSLISVHENIYFHSNKSAL